MDRKPTPFALLFGEKLPNSKMVVVKGEYDASTQSWKNPVGSSLSELPTTCTVATYINVDVTRADTANDD